MCHSQDHCYCCLTFIVECSGLSHCLIIDEPCPPLSWRHVKLRMWSWVVQGRCFSEAQFCAYPNRREMKWLKFKSLSVCSGMSNRTVPPPYQSLQMLNSPHKIVAFTCNLPASFHMLWVILQHLAQCEWAPWKRGRQHVLCTDTDQRPNYMLAFHSCYFLFYAWGGKRLRNIAHRSARKESQDWNPPLCDSKFLLFIYSWHGRKIYYM